MKRHANQFIIMAQNTFANVHYTGIEIFSGHVFILVIDTLRYVISFVYIFFFIESSAYHAYCCIRMLILKFDYSSPSHVPFEYFILYMRNIR